MTGDMAGLGFWPWLGEVLANGLRMKRPPRIIVCAICQRYHDLRTTRVGSLPVLEKYGKMVFDKCS